MSAAKTRRERLTSLLADAVGEPAARAALDSAALACGIDPERMGDADEQVLLRRISQSPGLIGVTAQLAAARMRLDAVQKRLKRSPG